MDIKSEISHLLGQHGIKLRQRDGELKQINVSIPNSIEDAFVIGLRYLKTEGTCTEDHFLCQKELVPGITPLEIEPHYKRRLEFRLPEYRGTHKQQVDFTQPATTDKIITSVNTITFLTDE